MKKFKTRESIACPPLAVDFAHVGAIISAIVWIIIKFISLKAPEDDTD